MIGDYNGNEFDEVYIFTVFQDSILLHALEYGSDPRYFIHNRFIAKLGKNLKDPDFVFHPGKITDMDGDKYRDLVFSITAGHSSSHEIFHIQHPPGYFAYFPKSGAFIAA